MKFLSLIVVVLCVPWKLFILIRNLENQETLYEPLIICLDDERSQLYERINNRVDLMFEAGLLDEAKWLF